MLGLMGVECASLPFGLGFGHVTCFSQDVRDMKQPGERGTFFLCLCVWAFPLTLALDSPSQIPSEFWKLFIGLISFTKFKAFDY